MLVSRTSNNSAERGTMIKRMIIKDSAALSVALTIMMLAIVAGDARAQVKVGESITAANAAKVKELVSPGTYWRVTHGMTMIIAPTDRIEWPPPYQVATEKYSAQVRLSADHRSLVGYVAGQPFPLIDANDPDVATKIMWNNA